MNEDERVILHKFVHLFLLHIVDILARHSPGKSLPHQITARETTVARRVSTNKQVFISCVIAVVSIPCCATPRNGVHASLDFVGPKAHTRDYFTPTRRCTKMYHMRMG